MKIKCDNCGEKESFDAMVNFNQEEAYVYSIDSSLELGRNRDLKLGEIPTELTARDTALPHVNHIDCGNCGEEIPINENTLNKIKVEKESWMEALQN